jgi:pimeloyl-ACP methyl ester carboxylesterase
MVNLRPPHVVLQRSVVIHGIARGDLFGCKGDLVVEIEVTSFGIVDDLRFVAGNVTGAIVPDSGHWIMEENPRATIKLITEFLVK